MVKGNAEIVAELAQEYSEAAVLERIRQLYRAELGRVVAEIDRLLPRYRRCVSGSTYSYEKAQLLLVKTQVQADSLDVWELEAALKYLLKTKQQFTEALDNHKNNVANRRRFQLEVQPLGTVKAFKQMTDDQADILNLALAAEDSLCRWRAVSASQPPKSTTVYEAAPEADVPDAKTEQHIYH